MASPLPDSPSLEKLRALARALQHDCRNTDAAALGRVKRHHPHPEQAAAQGFPLAAAQLTIARTYGFPGWPALRTYLDHVTVLGRSTPDDDALTDPADRFCLLACLRYDSLDAPSRWAAAREMLLAAPDLPQSSLHAAVAAGDAEATEEHLRAGAPVDGLGGPMRWTPLQTLTYARTGAGDPLATAELLIAAGAQVNAGILLGGLATPFTVLTGVFGEGEMGSARQPQHAQWRALATLLLEHGAEPNDAQSLYNRMFRSDNEHLDLLFAHGLGAGDGGPWRRRLGDATESVPAMMQRQIDWALTQGMSARLVLLAQHGFADPSGLSVRADELDLAGGIRGRTALHTAAWNGDLPLVRELLEAGADPTALDDQHHTTPAVWADIALQGEAADLLRAWAADPSSSDGRD